MSWPTCPPTSCPLRSTDPPGRTLKAAPSARWCCKPCNGPATNCVGSHRLPCPRTWPLALTLRWRRSARSVSIGQLRNRRTKRQQLLGIAAAGVIVLGGGGVLVTQLGDDSPSGDASGGAADRGSDAPGGSDLPDFDENTLPDAVSDLVTGGEGEQPLRLEGTPAPENCVPSVQIEGVDALIGVIEIRYAGRNRDAVFFSTSDPAVARVIVVDDCSLEDPEIEKILEGAI